MVFAPSFAMTSPIQRRSVQFSDHQPQMLTRGPTPSCLRRKVHEKAISHLRNKPAAQAETAPLKKSSPPRQVDLNASELGEKEIHELALARFSPEEQAIIRQQEEQSLKERFHGLDDLRNRYHQVIADIIRG